MKNIVVFGDSILKGIQLDPISRRYTIDNNIGVEDLEHLYSLHIENSSRFGCTITKAKQLLERTLRHGKPGDIVLLEYGGNDCDYDWAAVSADPDGDYECKTPLAVFKQTHKSVVEMLKSSGVTVFLTNLPPIIAERYLSWICHAGLSRENILKWLGSVETIYRKQELFSRATEEIARECDVPIIDLRSEFLKNRRIDGFFCEDGIHPNSDGQRLIGDAFRRYIDSYRVENTKLIPQPQV